MDSSYRVAAKKGDATTLTSYPSLLPVVMVAPLQFDPRTEATVQGSLGCRAEGLVGQVAEAQALEVRRGGQGQPAFLADAVVPQEQGGQVGQVGRGGQGDRHVIAHVIAGHVEAGDAGEARGLGDGPGPRGAEGTAAPGRCCIGRGGAGRSGAATTAAP